MEYDGGSLKSNNIHYLDFSKHKNQASPTTRVKYNSIENEVINIKPSIPVHFIRPNSIKKAANYFINNFPGQILYSVKSNPDQAVLSHLYNAGIRQFDVASLAEIKLISGLFPGAPMYFMHPIKSREAIHEAYFNYNIRDFSLDSFDELKKILEVTNNAKDLSLHVRLAIPNNHSAIDLSGKFGILPSQAVALVRKCRTVAKRLGICFHVGSQCMDPTSITSNLTLDAVTTSLAIVRALRY
jgi:ornithine decarboxylase